MFRRILAVAAACLAGTIMSLTVATPASAHHTAVAGDAVCDSSTGEWYVTWTVTNFQPDRFGPATLTKVVLTPPGSTVTNIAVGTVVTAPITGVQVLPGSATSASLAVRGRWNDRFVDNTDRSATVTLGGTCQEDKPKPNASFSSACDGTVTAKISNDADATKAAAFVVTGKAGYRETATLKAGESKELTVPAAAAGLIAVAVGSTKIAEYEWTEPDDCAPVKVSSKSDCTSLTVSLENPAGNRPVEATVKSGDTTKTLTVAPGDTEEVTFPAVEGTTATVTFGAGAAQAAGISANADSADEPITITWEKPGNCTPPPPPPSLPDTGAKVGTVIGIGAALVGLGIGLVVIVRRRGAHARW